MVKAMKLPRVTYDEYITWFSSAISNFWTSFPSTMNSWFTGSCELDQDKAVNEDELMNKFWFGPGTTAL